MPANAPQPIILNSLDQLVIKFQRAKSTRKRDQLFANIYSTTEGLRNWLIKFASKYRQVAEADKLAAIDDALWVATKSYDPCRGSHFSGFFTLVAQRRLRTANVHRKAQKYACLGAAVSLSTEISSPLTGDITTVADYITDPRSPSPYDAVADAESYEHTLMMLRNNLPQASKTERQILESIIAGETGPTGIAKQIGKNKKAADNGTKRLRDKLRQGSRIRDANTLS